MGASNYINHDNGIFEIELETFEQMKEWMLEEEQFEWMVDEDGNVSYEEVWDQLGYYNQDIVDEWLGHFADMVKHSNTGIEVVIEKRYNASAYNKGGKLIAKLELVSGYYDGVQVIVETDPEELFSGEYFDTKAELYEEYTPNNKRLLKLVKDNTQHMEVSARFSNGETMYSLAQ